MDINDKQLKQLLNELEQVKKLFDEKVKTMQLTSQQMEGILERYGSRINQGNKAR